MKKAIFLRLHFPSNNSFLRINNNNNKLLVETLLLGNLIFAQTVENFPEFRRT